MLALQFLKPLLVELSVQLESKLKKARSGMQARTRNNHLTMVFTDDHDVGRDRHAKHYQEGSSFKWKLPV